MIVQASVQNSWEVKEYIRKVVYRIYLKGSYKRLWSLNSEDFESLQTKSEFQGFGSIIKGGGVSL